MEEGATLSFLRFTRALPGAGPRACISASPSSLSEASDALSTPRSQRSPPVAPNPIGFFADMSPLATAQGVLGGRARTHTRHQAPHAHSSTRGRTSRERAVGNGVRQSRGVLGGV